MREKALLKILNKALKSDHLYSDDELFYMKKEAEGIKKLIENKKKTNSKGFGN
jgi:hypothetical protein